MQSRSGLVFYDGSTSESSSQSPEESLHAIRESGVDWMTCTCVDSGPRAYFDALGHELIAGERAEGVEVMPWSFQQFDGLNAGQVALGRNQHMSVLRLSSHLASKHWQRAGALATNCSRLDFQFTISGVEDSPLMIRECHDEAKAFVADWSKPPEVTLRDSNRTGPTLYLGTRRSNWFGRIYDKRVESRLEDYDGCVRAEVQFQKRMAKAILKSLRESKNPDLQGVGVVANLLEKRGIRRRWAIGAIFQVTCPRPRGGSDSRLTWLRTQVRPAVAKLIEAGYSKEVVEAIGLDHLVHGPHGPISNS